MGLFAETFHDISLARLEVARREIENCAPTFQKATFHHVVLKLASSLTAPGDSRRITEAMGMNESYNCEARAMIKLYLLGEES